MKPGAQKIDITVKAMDEEQFAAFYEDVRELSVKHGIEAPIVLLYHIGQLAQTMVMREVEECGVPQAESLKRHIETFAVGLGIKSVIQVQPEEGTARHDD